MSYAVKEIFYTLQGEGGQAGRAAVFCRFSGCNLWSGLERDRSTAACRFCDTDFIGTNGTGGGRYADPGALAKAVAACWPETGKGRALVTGKGRALVVCTGGEPLLQVDAPLIDALHEHGFTIAIESNGTRPVPAGIDWICISPKAGAPLTAVGGDELKLVFPQEGLDPSTFLGLDFHHFFLQPRDDDRRDAHVQAAAAYCLAHPEWRLSLQMHKLVGLP